MMIVKILALSNSKIYFIYFTTSLYNTPKHPTSMILFFFFNTSFKYSIFILSLLFFILSLSLSFSSLKSTPRSTTQSSPKPQPLPKPPHLPLTTPTSQPNHNHQQLHNPKKKNPSLPNTHYHRKINSQTSHNHSKIHQTHSPTIVTTTQPHHCDQNPSRKTQQPKTVNRSATHHNNLINKPPTPIH